MSGDMPSFDANVAPEADSELRLSKILSYLDECDAKLLAQLERAKDFLHRPPPRGWTVAQIVHQLILAEKVMMPIWTVVPTVGRWPRLLTMMDRGNAVLWRALGMRTVEAAEGQLVP